MGCKLPKVTAKLEDRGSGFHETAQDRQAEMLCIEPVVGAMESLGQNLIPQETWELIMLWFTHHTVTHENRTKPSSPTHISMVFLFKR